MDFVKNAFKLKCSGAIMHDPETYPDPDKSRPQRLALERESVLDITLPML